MDKASESVDTLIKRTLDTLDVPVERLYYKGDADKYITFQRISRQGGAYADDVEIEREHYFGINLFTKSDYLNLLERTEHALQAAGFYGIEINAETYEQKTGYYHVPIECYYMENLEV